MTTVTGFLLLYQDNIKACGFGKTFKFKYEFFAPRHQNFKSGFGFGFDTFTFWKKYFKLNISITDESVTTRTWWFAWLIPLSATEHVPQTVCPSRILTLYWQKMRVNIILPSTLSLLLLQFDIPWHCSLTKRQTVLWTSSL